MKKKDKEMNKMIQEYSAAMEQAKLMAFSQVVRRHDDAPLSSLVEFACTVGAGDITVGDLIGMPRTDAAWRRRLALPPTKSATKAIRGAVETRTRNGRHQYRERVFSKMVKDGRWMSSKDIKEMCGGSLDQVRSALSYLISNNRVDVAGVRRSVKYMARSI